MLEPEQFNPWIEAAQGYLSHFLQRLRQQPGLDRRSRRPRRTATWPATAITPAGIGKMGENAAAAIADFVVVDMFANYCTGREDVKTAMASAERSAKRIFR